MYINNTLWNGITGNIATALFIAGIFEIMNEYYLKEKLVDLIFEKIKLKGTIDKTGIVEIFSEIADIDYRYYFKKSSSNIDIYHVYGRTWTNSHIELLRDKVVRSNCKVRVILLSPKSSFIQPLAERYETSVEELQSNILKME
ncbi:hypothetical protein [Paenisporosarcina sp. TG-14]|uniref:hypothetical protein n=1 Tax=Paenisporosarcina sp. TG-14 TaxID=1231057 RepID=UPI000300590D|nr:hypothetical protein [Paenisporosarcina sp. TG-14]